MEIDFSGGHVLVITCIDVDHWPVPFIQILSPTLFTPIDATNEVSRHKKTGSPKTSATGNKNTLGNVTTHNHTLTR
jgi:hypothetical protein